MTDQPGTVPDVRRDVIPAYVYDDPEIGELEPERASGRADQPPITRLTRPPRSVELVREQCGLGDRLLETFADLPDLGPRQPPDRQRDGELVVELLQNARRLCPESVSSRQNRVANVEPGGIVGSHSRNA